jgi:uncharacterized glyoxalase superfamily metalloenzyme YdcJ
MTKISTTALRSSFAARLSTLYGTEVPAYTTLVEVSQAVNREIVGSGSDRAERLGSIDRVTAERHGAIRVGSPRELAQVARIFAALGMEPAGFYDLRDAHPQPIPVVSTAFRPVDRDELAINPFRVFTSMLVPEDRRFFDADLESRLLAFLDRRRLFPDELLDLADRAHEHGELEAPDAERFLDLAAASFALSSDPVDRAWYAELEKVSGVAADIGGVTTTHINHLTPRVLDIDELYRVMSSRGVEMIDQIQGPPRWEGPDVLLRQTSFKALSEPRTFRDPDGTITQGALRVRFGEVEARGIALTPRGRDVYDSLVAEVDRQVLGQPGESRQDLAADVWRKGLPATELGLWEGGLGFFMYEVADVSRLHLAGPNPTIGSLVAAGCVRVEPIVYEDFLPRSAAGIFESNLSDRGRIDQSQGGAHRDADWLADAMGRPVNSPEALYAQESQQSMRSVESALGVTLDEARPTGG